jgi:hypothetical protein
MPDQRARLRLLLARLPGPPSGARLRQLAAIAGALAGVVLIVAGVALLFGAPVGLVLTGVALLLVLTFDPSKTSRLTWPR